MLLKETKITRYRPENIITSGNNRFYEIRDRISVMKKENDGVYYVKRGDDLRDIAYFLYKDARLWWIIAEVNNIIDPFKNLVEGTELRYPSKKRIRQEIL